MNIFENNFSQNEAKLRYLDADYAVIRPGTFVRCAVTGKSIPLEDLTYWSVDQQEAYVDAHASLEALKRTKK